MAQSDRLASTIHERGLPLFPRDSAMATSDHPRDWVGRMVSNRGLNPPAKTLYWWSIHIDRFLAYCKKAGLLARERPECSAPLFLSSINRGGNTETYGYQQAQQAIDLFISELDQWHWNSHDVALPGPHSRLKQLRATIAPPPATGADLPPVTAQTGSKRASYLPF